MLTMNFGQEVEIKEFLSDEEVGFFKAVKAAMKSDLKQLQHLLMSDILINGSGYLIHLVLGIANYHGGSVKSAVEMRFRVLNILPE